MGGEITMDELKDMTEANQQTEQTEVIPGIVPVTVPGTNIPTTPGTTPAPERPNSLLSVGRAKLATTIARPKSVVSFNTRDLTADATHFHVLIYSDTNMRKTTIAAGLGYPESTLIILTRAKEQAIPLRDEGYEVLLVKDGDGLRYGLLNAESEWEHRRRENPALQELKTLVFDDATEGVNLLLDEGSSADNRKNYNEAGKELRAMLKSFRTKDIDVGIVALAKVKENAVTNRDKVGPDLPPSMLNMLGTEIEFAFYVMPETYQLLTERDWTSFTEEVEGKTKTYRVEIFAKNKLPKSLLGQNPPVLAKYEKPDLRAIWGKIQTAQKSVTNNATGPVVRKVTNAPVTGRRFGK